MGSKHFTVGTWIVMNNRRGEVTRKFAVWERGGILDKYLTVRWEDGSVSDVMPIALNRS